MIEIVELENVKTVAKPWGWEKWIQPGSDTYPYVLKQLQPCGAGRRPAAAWRH